MSDGFDHVFAETIVCPFCGWKDNDSWEWLNGEEGDGESECGECEKPFAVSRHVTVAYSTQKLVLR